MSIHNNNNYTIVVGKSAEHDKACYHVINKHTGVVEVEVSILPQAIQYADELDAKLFELAETAKKTVSLTGLKSVN